LRIAQVYDVPMANTKATADFIITSPFMDSAYTHSLLNFRRMVDERSKTL
jgi:methylglyoxal synthase